MAYYSSSHFYIVVTAGALVTILSVVVQVSSKKRSSWPTWLLLPLVAYMALVLATESIPPDVLHPLYLVTTLAVVGRWAVALLVRERDRGWILYTGVLAAVAAVAFFGGIVPPW